MVPALVLLGGRAAGQDGFPQLQFLNGEQPQERLGSCVAGIEDVDGDGHADVIVGLPGARRSGPGSGAVRLLSGANGQVLYELAGEAAGDGFGSCLTSLGDADGDGYGDFAIGAPNHSSAGPRSGAVYLYSGKMGKLLLKRHGEAPNERLGVSVAAVGDVDGDGWVDLAAGAGGAAAGAGAVVLFDGKQGRALHRVEGTEAGCGFGLTVTATGDLDGDRLGDYAVGAPEEDGGRVRAFSSASAEELWIADVAKSTERLGAALAGGLDVDGDGTPDVIAGLPGSAIHGADSGRVFVLSGEDGGRIHDLPGAGAGARFGSSVALLTDLDRDDRAELVIGAAGASGRGSVRVLSGSSGALLSSFRGAADSDEFGAAVAALGDTDGDGVDDLAVGGPNASNGGPQAGAVWTFAGRRSEPVAVGSGGSAEAGPPPAQTFLESDFLDARARAIGLHRVASPDGRWVIYGNVSPALVRETARLLDRFFARLDDVLGGAADQGEAVYPGPVVIAFVRGQDDVVAIVDEVAQQYPHLAEWATATAKFPRVQLYNPLLAIVRHSAALRAIKRPEVQVAHMAVQLELCRRYGRSPFWVGEAVGYALQDEIVDGVYGYSFRQYENLDEEYHQGWKWGAREALAGGSDLASLAEGSGETFDQTRAYRQFGLAAWWFRERPEKLRELFEQVKEARGRMPIESAYEPDSSAQADLFKGVFDAGMLADASRYWANARVTGGPGARIAAVLAGAGAVAEKYEWKSFKAQKGRIQLWSDFGERQSKAALATTDKIFKRLDKAIGKASDDDHGLLAVMVTDRDAYFALCDAVALGDPSLSGFMQRSKTTTGFNIYKPPMAVYFHDVRVQEEARPDHSVAHSLVHLDLYQRYGPLPLWLSEGLACAGEEGATGEVWANWYLDGFVYTDSRSSWRRRASEIAGSLESEIRYYSYENLAHGSEPPMVKRAKPELMELYGYGARPYRDDLAHLAYAFATYGLDKDRKGLKSLLELLQSEYQRNWVGVGRFTPEAATVERIVAEAFGDDFEEDLRLWWDDPPKQR